MNILVLCTGNSARSIMGEALFNHLGVGHVQAYSAGSKPVGKVNPFALRLLKIKGYDVTGFYSKSWDVFSGDGAPKIDIVVTVCGSAAGETCPVWIGAPITVHWGFADPAAVVGEDDEVMAAFEATYAGLEKNIKAILALDLEAMAPSTIKATMLDIHQNAEEG